MKKKTLGSFGELQTKEQEFIQNPEQKPLTFDYGGGGAGGISIGIIPGGGGGAGGISTQSQARYVRRNAVND